MLCKSIVFKAALCKIGAVRIPLFLLLLSGQAALCQNPALTIDRAAGPARIGVTGPAGATYTLESAASPSSSNWDLLITSPLGGSPQKWFDASSVTSPQRFYRARQLDSPPFDFPYDFRLIDQIGRSRWLYYYLADTNVDAIVLIFTGNGCQKVRDMIPTIKALTNRFAPDVLFWLVDSNQQDNRSNILAEAVLLGISNAPPILHDSAQLVARAYNALTTPEAVAISTSDLSVFYRGAIDDRINSNAVSTTQYYLSNALVSFLAGSAISPTRSRPAGCAISFLPRQTNISYSTEIAPLLLDKCVRCHSPGNIAPWSMTNHTAIADNALAIKFEIMSGRMPPWKADPHYSTFSNDSSLTPAEARKLVQWIDDGAIKGPAEPDPLASVPPQTNYPFAWPASLGQPDVILRSPLQSIPATGVLDYRYINVVNNGFGSNVWLRAAVVRPTNTRVVHHSLVFDGTTQLQGLDGFFAGYVPGSDATTFPAGTGKYLTNNQVLRFQMHYITIGSNQTDQTEIGLYKMANPPTNPLLTRAAFNANFTIPPNTNDYQLQAFYPLFTTLATNILLYEMSPHMHLRGSHFKYEVTYPAGHVPAKEILLSVPNYVFHWQSMFRLAQPKYIPKGSRIVCTAGWDNSVSNVELMEAYTETGDSRYSPSQAVGFEEQTFDEMFIGYLNYAEVP
jgi:hypothetical protein